MLNSIYIISIGLIIYFFIIFRYHSDSIFIRLFWNPVYECVPFQQIKKYVGPIMKENDGST